MIIKSRHVSVAMNLLGRSDLPLLVDGVLAIPNEVDSDQIHDAWIFKKLVFYIDRIEPSVIDSRIRNLVHRPVVGDYLISLKPLTKPRNIVALTDMLGTKSLTLREGMVLALVLQVAARDQIEIPLGIICGGSRFCFGEVPVIKLTGGSASLGST